MPMPVSTSSLARERRAAGGAGQPPLFAVIRDNAKLGRDLAVGHHMAGVRNIAAQSKIDMAMPVIDLVRERRAGAGLRRRRGRDLRTEHLADPQDRRRR